MKNIYEKNGALVEINTNKNDISITIKKENEIIDMQLQRKQYAGETQRMRTVGELGATIPYSERCVLACYTGKVTISGNSMPFDARFKISSLENAHDITLEKGIPHEEYKELCYSKPQKIAQLFTDYVVASNKLNYYSHCYSLKKENKKADNIPEKATFHIGEGKDALELTISQGKTTYEFIEKRNHQAFIENRPTNYISLQLESNNNELYKFTIKEQEDYCTAGSNPVNWGAFPGKKTDDIKMALAEKLYDDNSKEATAVKKFLSQIKGNVLVDEIKKLIEETPQRREEEARKQQEEQAKKVAEEQKRKAEDEQRKLAADQNKKNAENALNNFVGADKEEMEERKEKILANKEKTKKATNKLAQARKRVAKFVDKMSERMKVEKVVKKVTGGKKIEDVEINSRAKALEETISDTVLGKDR